MKKLSIMFVFSILSGCGTVNNALVEKTKNVEYYRIFDVKTQAGTSAVVNAASKGLGRNVNDLNESRPIPSTSSLPGTPGRFKLVSPFKGTNFAALAAVSGQMNIKVANCDEASWVANATRSIAGQSELRLTSCLFPYTDGYHLDFYATFSKKQGGLMELSRQAASAMVGTPEQWVEKTFMDTVQQIKADTGATVELVEAYPEISEMP